MGISDRGDLLYASGQRLGNTLVWVARDGTRTLIDVPHRNFQPEPRLSADGRRVALPIGDLDHYLWTLSIETGVETLVVARDAHNPVLSPDGRRIVFPLYGTGTAAGIALKDLESADEPEVVLEDSAIPTPLDWTPDEAAILFSRPTGSAFELGTLGLHDRTTRILLGSKRPITVSGSLPTDDGSHTPRLTQVGAKSTSPTSRQRSSASRCRSTEASRRSGRPTGRNSSSSAADG
jgi:hypothetical protein